MNEKGFIFIIRIITELVPRTPIKHVTFTSYTTAKVLCFNFKFKFYHFNSTILSLFSIIYNYSAFRVFFCKVR